LWNLGGRNESAVEETLGYRKQEYSREVRGLA